MVFILCPNGIVYWIRGSTLEFEQVFFSELLALFASSWESPLPSPASLTRSLELGGYNSGLS